MSKYVKEYKGHKVPEGAVYYGPETISNHEGFFDEEKCYLGIIVDGVFKPVFGQEKCSRLDIIELPLADEYVPEVGDKVKGRYLNTDWETWEITYMGDGVGCYRVGDNEYTFSIDSVVFKSYKSERDEFIEKALELAKVGDKAWLGNLYDNGARFTKSSTE